MLQRVPHEIDSTPENLCPDRGCEYSPRCIHCPLETCRYEQAGSMYQTELKGRHRAVMAARDQGKGVREILREFDIGETTYYRIIRRANKEGEA